jgi:hypothetical protein
LNRSTLVQLAYRFAREFGWTPQQIQEMTMAQIMLYEQMLSEDLARGEGSRFPDE